MAYPTGKRRLGIICEPVSNGTSSDGGVTGPHPAPSPLQVLAAPTTASDSNRVRMPLIPIACWKIEDIRFAFDSSFVTPDAAVEMQALKDLRESNSKQGTATDPSEEAPTQYPPISIFGHADPV